MMNQNIINNTAYDYLSYFGINMKHLDEIKTFLVETMNTKFYLYKRLCELVPNSRVTEERCWFIVEIDAEENRKLLDNIGKNFLILIHIPKVSIHLQKVKGVRNRNLQSIICSPNSQQNQKSQ